MPLRLVTKTRRYSHEVSTSIHSSLFCRIKNPWRVERVTRNATYSRREQCRSTASPEYRVTVVGFLDFIRRNRKIPDKIPSGNSGSRIPRDRYRTDLEGRLALGYSAGVFYLRDAAILILSCSPDPGRNTNPLCRPHLTVFSPIPVGSPPIARFFQNK